MLLLVLHSNYMIIFLILSLDPDSTFPDSKHEMRDIEMKEIVISRIYLFPKCLANQAKCSFS